MRIVFADPRPRQIRECLIECGVQHYLASQFYPDSLRSALTLSETIIQPTLIIDSGAFSAWNTGQAVDLVAYGNTIQRFRRDHGHRFSELAFVNLDVIPGKQGDLITPLMAEDAAQVGWQNYEYLRQITGETIIPVYHQGEEVRWLKKMVDAGSTYVGISPSNDEMTTARDQWLEYVFRFAPKNVRVHGFAVTSPTLMLHYPWFSVDSISYKLAAGYGKMFIFREHQPAAPLCIACSEEQDEVPGNVFERAALQKILLEQYDPRFTFDAIRHSKNYFRVRINIRTWLKIEAHLNAVGSANKHSQQPYFDFV